MTSKKTRLEPSRKASGDPKKWAKRARVLRKARSVRSYLLRLHRDHPGRPRLPDLSERVGSRELVLDTSVAVKFHVPEEQHEEASTLRSAFEEGQVELLAPGTILPEAFNAFWQLYRRGEFTHQEAREGWDLISSLPLSPS